MKTVSEMTFTAAHPFKNEYEAVVPTTFAQELEDRVKELEIKLQENTILAISFREERDSLRQQLEDLNANAMRWHDEAQAEKMDNMKLALSEARFRKALETAINSAGYTELGAQKVRDMLSTPPSLAFQPWVEFVKKRADCVYESIQSMSKEATQLLSSINFPGA